MYRKPGRIQTNRCPLAIAVALRSGTLLSGLSQAQDAPSGAMLEEVVVTATKRLESLQDVPISVNAVSAEKMAEAGIDRIENLAPYVPNLSMAENGIGTAIYIRGIGSGINAGFEQSASMYVDGVYYGRPQLSRAPFLDHARVEEPDVAFVYVAIAGEEEGEGLSVYVTREASGLKIREISFGRP